MSYQQYYEFRAVDQPLSPGQMQELRQLSTRADITRERFTNTYNYGSFRGDPARLMEAYFDAHVYVSESCTCRLMLRLPRTVLPTDMLDRYAVDEGLQWRVTDKHLILEWQRYEDFDCEWTPGEGWMDQLVPIRDELARGDFRSLYIGWLASASRALLYDDEETVNCRNDENGDENDETDRTNRVGPPIPAGLESLTDSQIALASFLDVERDLIAAAAQTSPDRSVDDCSCQAIVEWSAELSEQEVRAILVRLLEGEGMRVLTELRSRYHRARAESAASAEGGSGARSPGDLLAAPVRIQGERKRREYLAALARRPSELWSTVSALAEEQKASSYDAACRLLIDMRDSSIQAGLRQVFDAKLAQLLGKHSRRTVPMRRLKEAGLVS